MSKKKCARCKRVKDQTEFSFRNKKKGIRHSYCKECYRNICKLHYQKNKPKYANRWARRREKINQIIIAAKNKPCADCGEQYPYYVMDFDHRNGDDKDFNIGSKKYNVSMARLAEEIEKCDVICANCHRVRTFMRDNGNPLSFTG